MDGWRYTRKQTHTPPRHTPPKSLAQTLPTDPSVLVILDIDMTITIEMTISIYSPLHNPLNRVCWNHWLFRVVSGRRSTSGTLRPSHRSVVQVSGVLVPSHRRDSYSSPFSDVRTQTFLHSLLLVLPKRVQCQRCVLSLSTLLPGLGSGTLLLLLLLPTPGLGLSSGPDASLDQRSTPADPSTGHGLVSTDSRSSVSSSLPRSVATRIERVSLFPLPRQGYVSPGTENLKYTALPPFPTWPLTR